jgi:hypothetical protein
LSESNFSKILRSNKVELSDLQNKSAAWFRKQAMDMRKISMMTPESILRGDRESKGNTIIPGHLYMYVYDPLHKATLPFYDTFPLVFPFRKEGNNFWGLNLHYLPYHLRAQLLGKLMEFKSNSRYDETTKLKLSWQLLSASSKFAAIQPCVKQYRFDQVRSPFKAVHSSDWVTAMLLPIEHFEKADKMQVWAESMKIIRKP